MLAQGSRVVIEVPANKFLEARSEAGGGAVSELFLCERDVGVGELHISVPRHFDKLFDGFNLEKLLQDGD